MAISILLQSLISVIGIYLLFTPILYFCNFNAPSLIVMAVNVIRFILIVFVGVYLSRKNSIALKSSRKLSILFCALIGLTILLFFARIPQGLYGTLISSLHMYDRLPDNLFPFFYLTSY